MNMPVIRAALATGLCAGLLAGCPAAPAAPDVPLAESRSAAPSVASPSGWTPVTDAGTGVRADLPGPARKESEPVIGDDQEAQGVAYRAFEPSGRVEAVLHIAPLPTEERTGPQTVAERTAHLVDGEPPVTRPLVVEGHPAVDARIDGWPRAGGSGSGTLLLRIIDTPRFEITIEANGDTADDPLVREVFDRVCASLRIR